jgi:hypothetical protein
MDMTQEISVKMLTMGEMEVLHMTERRDREEADDSSRDLNLGEGVTPELAK